MRRIRRALAALAVCGVSAGLTGCFNPFAMGLLTPVPVQPWMGQRVEDQYMNKNDYRTPIMPPLVPGFPPPICEDPPSEGQVIRALLPIARGVPFVYEEFRDDYRVICERIVDKIDPPRFFPLVGLAQLHHCHWKCTVYFTETVQSDYPFPYKVQKPRVEVVYIDKDHLHLYTESGPEARADLAKNFLEY